MTVHKKGIGITVMTELHGIIHLGIDFERILGRGKKQPGRVIVGIFCFPLYN